MDHHLAFMSKMFPTQETNQPQQEHQPGGSLGATSSVDEDDCDSILPRNVSKMANITTGRSNHIKSNSIASMERKTTNLLTINTTSASTTNGTSQDAATTTPSTAISTPSSGTSAGATLIPPTNATANSFHDAGGKARLESTRHTNPTAAVAAVTPAAQFSSSSSTKTTSLEAKLLTTIHSNEYSAEEMQQQQIQTSQKQTDSNENSKSPSCSSRLFQNSGKKKPSISSSSGSAKQTSLPPSSASSVAEKSVSSKSTSSPATKNSKKKKPPRTEVGINVAPGREWSPRRGLMRGGLSQRARSVSVPRPPRGSSRSRAQQRPSIDNSSVTMEEFVHRSSRVQTFLGNAWQHVKHAATSNHRGGVGESTIGGSVVSGPTANNQNTNNKNKRRRRGSATAKSSCNRLEQKDDDERYRALATTPTDIDENFEREQRGSSHYIREQTTEIWRLKRQLQQAEDEFADLKVAHENLRLEFQSSQSRAQRAQNSLRKATENARSAQTKADAAETTAAHLAQQLQDLQTVVDETKKASRVLQHEQEIVEKKVARAETALHHKGLELARAHQKLAQYQDQHELFQSAQKAWERQQQALQNQLAEQEKLVLALERKQHESHALAESRLERLSHYQEEWKQAQTLLEEATESKLETQQTVVQLSEAITALQLANGDLHKQLQTATNASHEQTMQQHDALNKAEQATLNARIQKELVQEELDRLQHQLKQQQQQNRVVLRASTGSQSNNMTASSGAPRFSLPPLYRSSLKNSAATTDDYGVGNSNKENMQTTPSTASSKSSSSCWTTPLAMSKTVTAATPLVANKELAENELSEFATPTISNCSKDAISTFEINDNMSVDENSTDNHKNNGLNGRCSTMGNCAICNGMAYGLMKRCQCGKATCTHRAHLSCANRMPLSSKASLSHPGAPTLRLPMVLCSGDRGGAVTSFVEQQQSLRPLMTSSSPNRQPLLRSVSKGPDETPAGGVQPSLSSSSTVQ